MRKRPLKHVYRKNLKALLALILVICTFMLCTIPASASESETKADVDSEVPANVMDELLDTDTDTIYDEGNESEPDEEGTVPKDDDNIDMQDQKTEAEEEGEPEEPQASEFKVTYEMGYFGTAEEMVEENNYPNAVPETDFANAVFLGWYDTEDNPIYPESTVITADTKFIGKFERYIEDMLITDEHIAYIDGYSNHMFRPNNGITRGETAAIFYKLLQSTDAEIKTFSDVPQSQWYYDEVGVIACLGIVNGYSDGKFMPKKTITRAEFIKMAVSFDTINYEATANFTDVTVNHWAYNYIATAAEKGWIGGYSDGSFKPADKITRAQAVAIVNRMLGRYPQSIMKDKKDIKNFYDVFTDNWAYGDIAEAANEHEHLTDHDKKKETWTSYTKTTQTLYSHWITDGSDTYYLDAKTGKFVRGTYKIGGKDFVFDSTTGKAFTGFKYVGSWKRYFVKGAMVDDISKLGVVSGPYYIKVYKPSNYLIIFAKDGSNGYTIPVKAMVTSCGYGTPTGTYFTPDKYRWLKMVGDTWAQWCTQISGNYLFHSVPNWTYNNFDLEVYEYNCLGQTRSLGCIRLNCANAKWIYDNCGLGTHVYISGTDKAGPLSKPGTIQIPSWHTWDPTDPTAYYMCQRKGCH